MGGTCFARIKLRKRVYELFHLFFLYSSRFFWIIGSHCMKEVPSKEAKSIPTYRTGCVRIFFALFFQIFAWFLFFVEKTRLLIWISLDYCFLFGDVFIVVLIIKYYFSILLILFERIFLFAHYLLTVSASFHWNKK